MREVQTFKQRKLPSKRKQRFVMFQEIYFRYYVHIVLKFGT